MLFLMMAIGILARDISPRSEKYSSPVCEFSSEAFELFESCNYQSFVLLVWNEDFGIVCMFVCACVCVCMCVCVCVCVCVCLYASIVKAVCSDVLDILEGTDHQSAIFYWGHYTRHSSQVPLSQFLNLSCFASIGKLPAQQPERKWYDMCVREKMIYIDQDISRPLNQAGKWRKYT